MRFIYPGQMDAPGERPVSMRVIADREHYDNVMQAVINAKRSVWIATANLKDVMVEPPGSASLRRRKRNRFCSVLSMLADLAAKGVELRLLHAGFPSRAFRRSFDAQPELVAGGLDMRVCSRVHLKTVIVDARTAYIGSANWTGAGLGAKSDGRRNFEMGIVTSDDQVIDQLQERFDRIWRGAECSSCRLRDQCEMPLDMVGAH